MTDKATTHDTVVVPVEPTEAMLEAGRSCKPFSLPEGQSFTPGQIIASSVWTAMLAARPTASPGGEREAVEWHKAADSKPEPGHKFVALYDDGSGAWLGFAHDGGIIDSDGDDYERMKNAGWWAYLPSGFRLCCEDHPDEQFEVQLPEHVCPPLIALSRPAPDAVALTVWYGEMPESNGRRNWTATLRRVTPTDKWPQEFCFARSEYPDRVRYEADRMRWIIGERAERPDILAYDADLHSGYVAPGEAVLSAAERAFTAWAATSRADGTPLMWTWAEMPESQKQRWAKIAEAALSAKGGS